MISIFSSAGSTKTTQKSFGLNPLSFWRSPNTVLKERLTPAGTWRESIYFPPLAPNGAGRTRKVSRSWELIYEEIGDPKRFRYSAKRARCGPFSFEIRAWDIGAADTREISESFGYQRSLIRKAISAHKGISIYRDGVLVLPKSENARDWLGLDLRRVSNIGRRLSTSQLVGYVFNFGRRQSDDWRY